MASLDNQDNNIFPLTLDNLNYISVNGINLNNQSGVVQALNDGSLYADYNVNLDQITPASLGNTIDIVGNVLVDNSISINGATLNPSYGANIGGDVNITGSYRVNGVPLTFTSSYWTPDGATGIFRNSRVGIGSTFNALTPILYDLQLGAINTSAQVDRTLSIPIAFQRTAKIRMSESGGSAGLSEAGFDLSYNGANDRFEILGGNNPIGSAGANFTTRSLTINRNNGFACFGSVAPNLSFPLSVISDNTQTRQLNINGQSSTSLAVNNGSGNLDVCIAGANGAFSTDALTGDSVLRQTTANRKLMLQCGSAASAICIDNLNNIGIGGFTGGGNNKMRISGSLGVVNNNIFVIGNTNGIQFGNNPITNQNGIFNDSALNGLQIFTNNSQAIRIDSLQNVSVGGTNPVSSQRLRIDGNLNVQGGSYLLNGITLNSGNIPENTNLYYTTARATTDARNAISVSSTNTINLTFNNSLGIISADLATTAGFSNWTPFGTGDIIRNSRIGVNSTLTVSSAGIYVKTDPSNNIIHGLFIESPNTGSSQIVQKTSNSRYVNDVSSLGYRIINQSSGSPSNYLGVNNNGSFTLYNNSTTNGVELKFFDGGNFGASGSGGEIFYGPSTDRTLYFLNQEGLNSNGIQFWTNSTNTLGNISERWRISASGSLNNIGLEDPINALRVSGNILLNSLSFTNSNIISTTGNLIFGLTGSTFTTQINVSGLSTHRINCSFLNMNQINCSFINTNQINGLGLITTQIYNVVGAYPNNFNTASFVKTSATSKIRVHLRASAMQTAIVMGTFFMGLYNATTNAYMSKFVTYNHIHNFANFHFFWGGMMLMNDTNTGVPAGSYYLRVTFTNLFNNGDDYCYIAVDESN